MKKIEKILKYIESQRLSVSEFERSAGLSNGYLSNTDGRGADVTQKILDKMSKKIPLEYEAIFGKGAESEKNESPPQTNGAAKEESTVSLLARALDHISEANRALARIVEENQKAILEQVTTNTTHLIETKTDVGIVAAMQNAYHEYWAEHVPPKNQTPKQVMREIHNKAFASLEKQKKGNN